MVDAGSFDVLNAIYLRKMATADHLELVTELPANTIQAIISREIAEGAVHELGGSYMLRENGIAKVLGFYRETYSSLREQAEVMRWYEKFEANLNQQFIRAISDWQMNDRDERAQAAMTKLVERMIRSLQTLSGSVPRYQKYLNRFGRAMALLDQGNSEFACSPMVDSIHNVWFEFHEDILAVVGRPRDV
jgi:hypothetical protein